MMANVLLLLWGFLPSAFAEDFVVIQSGQMFLDRSAESKAETIKADPSKGKDLVVKRMKIKKGDRITFKNMDKVTHNVSSDQFDLKAQTPGEEKTQVFDKAGKQSIECAIHPKMKFELEVQ